MRGVYWVRNDLRLHDNKSINSFFKECDTGLLLWCPTKSYLRAGEIRKNFIDESLYHFSQSLLPFGLAFKKSNLDIVSELESIYQRAPFERLYLTQIYSTEELNEEKAVKDFCAKNHIQVTVHDQETLIHEVDLPFPLEKMPFIFSDFRRKVESSLVIRPPEELTTTSLKPLLNVDPLFAPQKLSMLFNGGEQAALKRLREYLWETKSILSYKETRNGMIRWDDSTKLSPWLGLGLLSPRMILSELQKFEAECDKNESTYWLLFELFWRDYLKFLSKKYGNRMFLEDGIKKGKDYSPKRDRGLFEKWCKGDTAERFVNANMNELNQTGWMSNRGRQNVASYLVHHLKLPWTWGAMYFEQQLIDYDCDLNWGNWLYLSGNGTDPRARIFNIKRQAEVYDAQSEYQEIWAPLK